MQVLPRKGKEHMGADWQMPGKFYCLGAHLSQHSGADAEIEHFKPTFCACTTSACQKLVPTDGKAFDYFIRGIATVFR